MQWQILVPYGSNLHIPPTNYHLLTAQQKPYKKEYLLRKNTGKIIWRKRKRKATKNGPLAERWQDKKSNKTWQKNKREDRKGDDIPEIQTESGHQTSWPPFRGYKGKTQTDRSAYSAMFSCKSPVVSSWTPTPAIHFPVDTSHSILFWTDWTTSLEEGLFQHQLQRTSCMPLACPKEKKKRKQNGVWMMNKMFCTITSLAIYQMVNLPVQT